MSHSVLIIEDDKFLVDIYSTKFREAGFTVDTAEDGMSGMSKIKEMKPDIVLLDIVMPRMDGFAVLQQLRASPDLKNIHVVLLTNLGQKEDVERGLELGAEEYIVKAHHTPTEVVARVKEILEPKPPK